MDIINHYTTCDEAGWPNGYQCLHLAANGSARNSVRKALITQLIAAKADVNAKTNNQKANTAASLAAGQGATDVSKLILALGGDKTAKNSLGKGMLQMSRLCSTTTTKALLELLVPDTAAVHSGRTRNSDAAPSRQDRRARAHASWTYGSQPSDQHGWQSSSSSSWNHREAEGYFHLVDNRGDEVYAQRRRPSEAHASWTYGSQPFIFQQQRRSSNRSTSRSGGRR